MVDHRLGMFVYSTKINQKYCPVLIYRYAPTLFISDMQETFVKDVILKKRMKAVDMTYKDFGVFALRPGTEGEMLMCWKTKNICMKYNQFLSCFKSI